jgi:histidinol-phosphate/aromatic aminotransferase/cobyric acid decarboxylase-like protein
MRAAPALADALRISVGTPEQNAEVVAHWPAAGRCA